MAGVVTAPGASTMKAIVQEGYGSADVVRLREVERPALQPGRALVRVRAAAVNAAEWHVVHGGLTLRLIAAVMRQPKVAVLGTDVAGVVEAVAEGVTSVAPGDAVFGAARGAFAEFAIAREALLRPIPRGLGFEQAAAIGIAGSTALQAVRDHAGVRSGQHVLVNGAGGGVGTFAVQIAKALGARVTAVTGPRNVDVVGALGPDELVDRSREDFVRRPTRYDAVIDIAADRSLRDLRRVLVPGGTLVLVGAAKSSMPAVLMRIASGYVRSRVLKQRIVFFVAKLRGEDLEFLRQLVETDELRPVVDRTYPLAQASEALRYLGTGQARAKVVITVP